MLDKNKILSKISFMKKSKSKLEKLATLSEDEFLNNFINYDSAKYNLLVMIEAMIDICNHIISRRSFEIPSTSADSIKILVKNNLLPEDEQSVFIAMVKFRNRVVHLYQDIDDKEVYKILNSNLNDIDSFLKEVIKLI
jgi:uncharacterized protein YutE (UPF0331/DUF86 family)